MARKQLSEEHEVDINALTGEKKFSDEEKESPFDDWLFSSKMLFFSRLALFGFFLAVFSFLIFGLISFFNLGDREAYLWRDTPTLVWAFISSAGLGFVLLVIGSFFPYTHSLEYLHEGQKKKIWGRKASFTGGAYGSILGVLVIVLLIGIAFVVYLKAWFVVTYASSNLKDMKIEGTIGSYCSHTNAQCTAMSDAAKFAWLRYFAFSAIYGAITLIVLYWAIPVSEHLNLLASPGNVFYARSVMEIVDWRGRWKTLIESPRAVFSVIVSFLSLAYFSWKFVGSFLTAIHEWEVGIPWSFLLVDIVLLTFFVMAQIFMYVIHTGTMMWINSAKHRWAIARLIFFTLMHGTVVFAMYYYKFASKAGENADLKSTVADNAKSIGESLQMQWKWANVAMFITALIGVFASMWALIVFYTGTITSNEAHSHDRRTFVYFMREAKVHLSHLVKTSAAGIAWTVGGAVFILWMLWMFVMRLLALTGGYYYSIVGWSWAESFTFLVLCCLVGYRIFRVNGMVMSATESEHPIMVSHFQHLSNVILVFVTIVFGFVIIYGNWNMNNLSSSSLKSNRNMGTGDVEVSADKQATFGGQGYYSSVGLFFVTATIQVIVIFFTAPYLILNILNVLSPKFLYADSFTPSNKRSDEPHVSLYGAKKPAPDDDETASRLSYTKATTIKRTAHNKGSEKGSLEYAFM